MKLPHITLTWVWWSLLLTLLIVGTTAGLLAQRSSYAQDADATPAVTEPVSLYGLLELSFSLANTYQNPYDPDEINVSAAFHPPDGETMQVPGFYMRPYRDTCAPDCPAEWRVRFAPDQIGHWTYTIEAHDASGTQTIQQGAFEVVPSQKPGYVRIGPNPRYFAFDSGAAYFPVGENRIWSADERWLDELAAAGVNYARLNVDFPHDETQAAAWQIDTILQMAAERGIYLQIVLIEHPLYTATAWADNPYSSDNGGTLSAPSALFTDAETTRLLKQRLRYNVARWGYSPHIFAWELIDAVDEIQGFTLTRADPWLADLTRYLRSVDPYDHLITVGAMHPDPAFWTHVDQDFAQARFYPTLSSGTIDALGSVFVPFAGPIILSQYAPSPPESPSKIDPAGIHIQTTIWPAALSGAAGVAVPWTAYPEEMPYSPFNPLVLFARDVPWHTANLEPIPAHLVSSAPVTYQPLRVEQFNRRFLDESVSDIIYQLTADGWLPSADHLSAYLYGSAYPAYSRPLTFTIAPPVDTELIISIRAVSAKASAALTVTLDGREAARVDFSPASDNIVVTVPVSSGTHTVTLDNLGEEWLQIDYIALAQYILPLRALVLADQAQGTLIAWIHNRDYTWQNVAAGKAAAALDADLRVPAMPIGVYRVTFWDTITGAVIGEEQITLNEDSDGLLRIKLLPIASQLAVSALRIAGPPVESTPVESGFSTRTPLPTHTATVTASPTPTDTPTLEPTDTPTPTATRTPSQTPRPTETPTPSQTPTLTATATQTPSRTPAPTRTATVTPRPSPTTLPSPTLVIPDTD